MQMSSSLIQFSYINSPVHHVVGCGLFDLKTLIVVPAQMRRSQTQVCAKVKLHLEEYLTFIWPVIVFFCKTYGSVSGP